MECFLAQVVQVHATNILTNTNEQLNPYIHTKLRQNPKANACSGAAAFRMTLY